jgi:hypothetical protein
MQPISFEHIAPRRYRQNAAPCRAGLAPDRNSRLSAAGSEKGLLADDAIDM